VLDWDARDTGPGRKRLELVQNLLAIRRREIVPRLADARFGRAQATDDGLLTADWRMGDGAILRLLANISNRDLPHAPVETAGTLVWGSEFKLGVPPWAVSWRIG
jgi:maltooligosyltrehalose trehalohydrolase